ncbi:MAG: hypothetical protein R2882_04765 [Gemmatimonadales bacterium]
MPLWTVVQTSNQIASPVVYGVDPIGDSGASPPPALEGGGQYGVRVGIALPPSGPGGPTFVLIVHDQTFAR